MALVHTVEDGCDPAVGNILLSQQRCQLVQTLGHGEGKSTAGKRKHERSTACMRYAVLALLLHRCVRQHTTAEVSHRGCAGMI